MQTKLKISATILLIEDDYENLKKTINSIAEEVDNIFVISNKKIIYNDLKFTLIQDNKFDGDFSSFRNKIRESLPDHILFHLNCGEILETKDLKDFIEQGKNYKVNVIYDQFIIKEVRIATKKDFVFTNKVFESINCDNFINSIIKINASKTTKINFDSYLNQWEKKEPLNTQVYYYKTINNLFNNNFNQFVNDAEKLIFKSDLKEENELLLRYYLANIFIFKIKNDQKFIENILTLLAKKPEMPEFWCLAGDYWYMKNNFKNAKYFYKYALISGNYKNFNDELFYMPDKYLTYPTKMIANCNKVLESQSNFKLN